MDISELVENYRRNGESYTSAQHNETQLRREYLDPFFTLLGWDIDNKYGYAEAYKDVVHEDAIKIGLSTRAPDYSFDECCFITQGAKPFQAGKGKPPQTDKILKEKPYVASTQVSDTFRPLLRGSLIHRYSIIWKTITG